MPPRDWRKVVDDFTRVQQLVHLANRLQPESVIDIQGKLYQQKRVAYEDTLTAQAAAVGCAGKKGVTDMATLANMMGEAGDEAEGIINTYNYDMALAIRNIAAITPTANRHVYAKRLAEWEAIRNEWKSKQIMLWNTMKWQDKAIADFLEHNSQLRQGTAEVQPQETAVCDICRTWVERGKVPIARTKEVDWPAHLNCPHHWVIKYSVESVDCSKLWVGTDFDAWLAQVGQKGGAGSGNWGHLGRPGLRGGSGGSARHGVASFGDTLPDKLLNPNDDVLLMIDLEGRGDVIAGLVSDFAHHGNLAEAVNISSPDQDKTVRARLSRGIITFNSYFAAPFEPGRTGTNLDRQAERNIARAARKLISAGYAGDTKVKWEMAMGPSLNLLLRDMKEHAQ